MYFGSNRQNNATGATIAANFELEKKVDIKNDKLINEREKRKKYMNNIPGLE